MTQRRHQERGKKQARVQKPLKRSMTIDDKEWSYDVSAVYMRVRSPEGKTIKLTRAEFHRFATITPADVKRFILNGLDPVDYPFGGDREKWQRLHDGMDDEDEAEDELNAEEEWERKVESGEIFVDEDGDPLDPADELYPEHAKLKKAQDKSQAIGEFLDWLSNERPKGNIFLCERHPTHEVGDLWMPFNQGSERLLAEYFGIDEAKLEAEKRKILDAQRKANAKS